jgi:hypothetical protein
MLTWVLVKQGNLLIRPEHGVGPGSFAVFVVAAYAKRSTALCAWTSVAADFGGPGHIYQFFGRSYQAGCPTAPHLTGMEQENTFVSRHSASPIRQRWTLATCLALAFTIFLPIDANSQVPCDFKGISVGDKMSREQVMQRLGVRTFKVDPSGSEIDWNEVVKYGSIAAAERQDDKTGPYCHEDYCNIPCCVFVGDDKFNVKVFVALKDDVIYAIEVSFNMIFWNDIWNIIVEKYGPAWELERDTIGVMDYETKKVDQFERVMATHKIGGTNPHTNDTCSLSATNIDIFLGTTIRSERYTRSLRSSAKRRIFDVRTTCHRGCVGPRASDGTHARPSRGSLSVRNPNLYG